MPGRRKGRKDKERYFGKKTFTRDGKERRDGKDSRSRYFQRCDPCASSSWHQDSNRTLNSTVPNWKQSRQKTNRETNASKPHPRSESAQGTSRADKDTTNHGDELEIPGFFYDKEKKRYFKIAPNHCSNLITKETIQKKITEEKRQDDLKRLFDKREKKKNQVHSLVPVLNSQRAGLFSSDMLSSSTTRATVCNLKPVGSQYLFDTDSPGSNENLEHMQIMRVTPDCDEILGHWSLKDTWVQRIQLLKLSELRRSSEKQPLSLHAKPHQKVIIHSLNKVTDMCFASVPGWENQRHVLCTSICHTGQLYSLAMIRNLGPNESNTHLTVFDYNLGRKASWACAWNQQKRRFSVGSEKSALVLDVETRRMWEYHTNGGDPFAQTFSHQGGQILYNGTRKGEVLAHDLRSLSTRPVTCLKHSSSVCGLHLLEDNTRIVAGDFTGRLCLWDLRKKDVAVEYFGGVNHYTKLPVHVDQGERTVYGVGQDGYTRFWCLREGTLLHSIPPPRPVSRETIPTVHFSMNWANRPGNAGLVMGLENKLYFYGKIPLF